MKNILCRLIPMLLLIPLILVPSNAKAAVQNQKDPIILIHGLAGWGRDEVPGFKYWGGFKDIEAHLNQQGYQTYTAAVGPFSSNWDRAAELYAYIKGGTVDYGAAHAKEHGHDRYGRTYPGVYPQWSEQQKVNLIGHSMGGQTERVLLQLLKEGHPKEQEYTKTHPGETISPLFEGNKSWVRSVTSIGTAHNGSSLGDKEDVVSFFKTFVLKIASLSGNNSQTFGYDFKLDQWGIKRKQGESFEQYIDRVFKSPVWNTKDSSAYDLTTNAAKEINQWVKTFDDVYYFSYTGNATYPSALTGHALPVITMNPLFYAPSLYIGSHNTKEWWPNDGLVSVISSQYPFGHPNQPYTGTARKGVWNYTSPKKDWDHIDFIGIDLESSLGIRDIYSFYNELGNNINRLPNN
ncbi:lipase [Bacillus cereus]|nr:lipase [Bacillus cereus]